MNHDEENSIEQMIQVMLEMGISIQVIEETLGVKIQSRVLTVEYVVQVVFSPMCGEIELSMN